jgi:soluble lytic murein transglycosylase-like protein
MGAVKKSGGIPPFEETREYVERVLRLYQRYKDEARR